MFDWLRRRKQKVVESVTVPAEDTPAPAKTDCKHSFLPPREIDYGTHKIRVKNCAKCGKGVKE